MSGAGRIHVTKSDPPESTEILADAVVRISKGFKRLSDSGLNQKAIITLLTYETKVNRTDIKIILDALPRLAGWYCKKDKPGG